MSAIIRVWHMKNIEEAGKSGTSFKTGSRCKGQEYFGDGDAEDSGTAGQDVEDVKGVAHVRVVC
jgi:hypothetical protein